MARREGLLPDLGYRSCRARDFFKVDSLYGVHDDCSGPQIQDLSEYVRHLSGAVQVDVVLSIDQAHPVCPVAHLRLSPGEWLHTDPFP